MGGLPGDFSTAPARLERSLGAWRCAWRGNYGTMMRDSSRLWSGDCGNWPRRNSMKRREGGRAVVRQKTKREGKNPQKKKCIFFRGARAAHTSCSFFYFDIKESNAA